MARRSDHSREEIRIMAIAAARKIVSEQGHNRLSARSVASDIGYTAGTLYNIFENLDDLVLQVNAITMDKLVREMSATATTGKTAIEKLKTFAQSYLQQAHDDPNLWQMVFDHRMPEGTTVPGWYLEKSACLFTLVEDQVAASGIRGDATCRAYARTLWAGVHGICDLSLSGKLHIGGECREKQLVNILIDSLLSAPGGNK